MVAILRLLGSRRPFYSKLKRQHQLRLSGTRMAPLFRKITLYLRSGYIVSQSLRPLTSPLRHQVPHACVPHLSLLHSFARHVALFHANDSSFKEGIVPIASSQAIILCMEGVPPKAPRVEIIHVGVICSCCPQICLQGCYLDPLFPLHFPLCPCPPPRTAPGTRPPAPGSRPNRLIR